MRQILWSNPSRPSRPTRSQRYAPEFLERKLSPSTLPGAPVAAQVQVSTPAATVDHPPTFPPYDPTWPPHPTDPNPHPTPYPGGPSGPDCRA